MAAKKSKRPLMTFLSPEQMAAQNPWGGMLQNPTQAAINNSADESQAARKALGVIGQAREDSPVAMDNSREAASPIPLVEQFNQMALIPKGTGPRDTWMDRVTQKNQEQNKITENLYASPEEYNQLVGAVMNTEPVRQQQALLEAQDELAQDVISNYQTGMDLSPLMALTDAWSAKNPNLARAYKAPPGYGEKAKLLLDYGSKMADDRQKLMDKIMSGVQYMKTGTTSTGTLADLAALTQRGQTPAPPPKGGGSGRGGVVDAKWVISNSKKLSEDFNKDMADITKIKAALSDNSIQGLNLATGYISRVLGGQKGVLTDKDLKLVTPQGIKLTLANLEAYVTSNPNVRIDPKFTKRINELIVEGERKLREKYAGEMRQYKDAVSKGPTELSQFSHLVDSFAIPPMPPEPPKKNVILEMLQKMEGGVKK